MKFNKMIKEVTVNKSLKDILDKAGPINNSNIKITDLENQASYTDEVINEWKTKYLYLQADLENIKKRYNKQIEDIRKYEGENVFKELIDFVDFLQLQIDNNGEDQRLLEIKNKMLSLLNIFDVKPIYEERPMYFNDQYDEAILSKDCNDKTLDNSIENVYKQGWMFKDKILRYEQVVVNKYKENHE